MINDLFISEEELAVKYKKVCEDFVIASQYYLILLDSKKISSPSFCKKLLELAHNVVNNSCLLGSTYLPESREINIIGLTAKFVIENLTKTEDNYETQYKFNNTYEFKRKIDQILLLRAQLLHENLVKDAYYGGYYGAGL